MKSSCNVRGKTRLPKNVRGLESLTQGIGAITKNQEEIIDYLNYLSAFTTKSKEEVSELIKQMKAMRKAQ